MDDIVAAWNDMADLCGLSKVTKITPIRKRLLRLATSEREHTYDEIIKAINTIPDIPFLLGTNQDVFKASFDWLFSRKNDYISKILEGGYGNKTNERYDTFDFQERLASLYYDKIMHDKRMYLCGHMLLRDKLLNDPILKDMKVGTTKDDWEEII